MFQEMVIIKKVSRRNDLNSGARLTWIKLFLEYGYDVHNSQIPLIAESIDEFYNTFKVYWKILKRMKAIHADQIWEKGRLGIVGVRFNLIPPEQWLPKGKRKTKASFVLTEYGVKT